MNHVAIDLGGRESQICVRGGDGQILQEERRPTLGLQKYLGTLEPAKVVVETCPEAFMVAEWARSAGHHVTVVPASLVRALGVGSRGIKNDVRDARNLSEASCRMPQLPSVHIPRAASRELKSLCTLRDSLVTSRTKLINSARGWLRGQAIGRVKRGSADSFTQRLRALWREKAGGALPPALQRQALCIDVLTEQMLAAEQELQDFAKADATCQRLMTVPGVGPLVAVRFFCSIDGVSRFSSAHALQSYIGLTPGEDSSSDKKRSTGITKAGAPRVRWLLQQAAWVAWRFHQNDAIVQWAEGRCPATREEDRRDSARAKACGDHVRSLARRHGVPANASNSRFDGNYGRSGLIDPIVGSASPSPTATSNTSVTFCPKAVIVSSIVWSRARGALQTTS